MTGLDPNPYMFDYAHSAAAAAGLRRGALTLTEGSAEAMPFADASFDTVVSTLTLCSVSAPRKVLAEAQRVLAPGGRFVFVEHVRAFDFGGLLLAQTALEPFQRLLADNCHLTRQTGALIEGAGFADVKVSRFEVEGASVLAPHVSGVAVTAR